MTVFSNPNIVPPLKKTMRQHQILSKKIVAFRVAPKRHRTKRQNCFIYAEKYFYSFFLV